MKGDYIDMKNINVLRVVNTIATVAVGVGTIVKIVIGGKVDQANLEDLVSKMVENKMNK